MVLVGNLGGDEQLWGDSGLDGNCWAPSLILTSKEPSRDVDGLMIPGRAVYCLTKAWRAVIDTVGDTKLTDDLRFIPVEWDGLWTVRIHAVRWKGRAAILRFVREARQMGLTFQTMR